MMRPMILRNFMSACLTCALLVTGFGGAAQAQGLFSTVRKVNDQVITRYDVEQRIRFMELLNAGGADMRREAIDRLTDEAIQREAARRLKLRVTRDELLEGLTEFAGRADMTAEQFVTALGEGGVARETLEAFVQAGLLWRKYVAAQFPALVTVVGSDVARARDTVTIVGTTRVLMSEIFLPTDPQFADAVAQIMELIEAVRSVEEFATLAREFSLAGTRDQGGRLDWLPIENLPPQIGGLMRAARPGQVVGPIDLSGAIAYFQLRALDSSRVIPTENMKLTYARLLLPGGRSEANLQTVANIQTSVRNCPDLGPFARGLSEQALTERSEFLRAIPQSDAVELARLDQNEVSANTVESGNLVVLMLCARELEGENLPTPAQTNALVFDQRLAGLAEAKLRELVADADIRDF
ncbi:MAG: peptidylprolyl isomerase [Roseinatronobacter sp.]